MHGGSVSAESSGEGSGASFGIMMPLLLSQKVGETFENSTNSAGKPESDFDGVRILIVDDDEDSREMLKFILEDHHAQIITLDNATDALARFPVFEPHVLISDLGMPGMDGYDLIRLIRELPPENGGRVPAIALTGYVGIEEQKRVKSSGFDIHVAKPVDFNSLLKIIDDLLHQTSH
jgi:CheY-like chemotaxis protein